MFTSQIPKSILRSLTKFPALSQSNSTWICHYSTKSPQILTESKNYLLTLFSSMTLQRGSRNSKKSSIDHELELVSALKSCSSLKAVFQGQQIHSFILKIGLDSNILSKTV